MKLCRQHRRILRHLLRLTKQRHGIFLGTRNGKQMIIRFVGTREPHADRRQIEKTGHIVIFPFPVSSGELLETAKELETMANSGKKKNSKGSSRPPRKKKPTPKRDDPTIPPPKKVIPTVVLSRKSDWADPNELYILEVLLTGGPVTEEFVEDNPVVQRTIEIPGDYTLTELHDVLFDAFDRYDEHLFEFQMGKKPMDRSAKKYTTKVDPMLGQPLGGFDDGSGDTEKTKIGAIGLKRGSIFWYWFDFGDDWWHKITVKDISETDPEASYPRVTERIGKSPPQYFGMEDEDFEDEDFEDEDFEDEEDVKNEEGNKDEKK